MLFRSPAIAVGKAYGVVATRTIGSPGNGCASALVTATITDQKKFPVVTLTATDNTACDGAFDGSVKVSVTTAGFDATTKYLYDWNDKISIPPTAFPISSVFTKLNSTVSETFPVTFSSTGGQKLSDGIYTVRVKNDVNQCSSTGTVTMKKSTVDPVITGVTALNKLKCTPDGSVTVGPIDIGTLTGVSHSEFDFTWFNGAITNPPLSLVLAPGALPDVLNKTTLPGIGAGVYFVKVQRKSGLSPGSGCPSLPFRAEVKDKSVKPVVQLSSLANSACGDQYNAEITVTPSTTGFPVTTKYSYEWGPFPAGTKFDSLIYRRTSPIVFASSTTQLLRDGSYEVKVTNTVNECEVTGTVDVQQNIIPPVISSVSAIDQFKCAADGSVTVGSVEVGTTAVVPPADFDYKWFSGSLTNPLTLSAVGGNNVLDNTDLSTMGAGKIGRAHV